MTSIKILKIPPHLKGLCATRDTVCATIKVSIPVIYLPKFSHSCTMEIHSVLGWISHLPPKNPLPQNPLQPTQPKKGWGVNLGNQKGGVKTLQPIQIIQPIFWRNDSPEPFGQNKKTDLLPKKLVLLSYKARTIAKGWSQHDLIGFFDEGISGSTTIFERIPNAPCMEYLPHLP